MPRGRPKGSRKLTSDEKIKVKQTRDVLSSKRITRFDSVSDAKLLANILVTSKQEIFVKYEMYERVKDETKDIVKILFDEVIRKLEKE